jgi:hypothetical protein
MNDETPAAPPASDSTTKPRSVPKKRTYLNLADVLEDELEGKCLTPEERKALASASSPDPKKRLDAVHKRLHDKKCAALCLSGGGIRSATFALGVLPARE